jgi:hypothetical protein
MSDTQACLGGWCRLRDNCMHYHAADRRMPAERLCDRGQDGACLSHRIVLWRSAAGLMLPAEQIAREAA